MKNYRQISYWFDSLEDVDVLSGNIPDQVDVAIIGAGFTGLWTAYYLKKQSPEISITVLEAETVGFGASGRNGGWCMGAATGMERLLHRSSTRSEGIRLQKALHETVDEIGRVCDLEKIDCHFVKGGTLNVAGTRAVAIRHQEWIKFLHSIGFPEEDYCWLDEQESASRIRLSRNHGAFYTSHCAAVHPARLVRGLGEVCRQMGISIVEKCPVLAYRPGRLTTGRGEVIAEKIIRATEGYTDSIKNSKRQLLPLYSMVIATEPMSDEKWQEIGLANRETFDDGRRVVIYGQRTLDNRLVFGGRAGYYFGSKIRPTIPRSDKAVQHVESAARELIPALAGVEITHGWGGLMGVPRHWRPCVSYDEANRLGWAGGYTGEGVGASNLAARIMSDLVLGHKSDLATLPWVDDNPRKWEQEPIRWLGVKSIEFFGDRADKAEAEGKSSSVWGALFDQFVG